MNKKWSVAILGTRGIPARHGGFETFAEKLSLYLSRHGWKVFVYCQGDKSVRRRIDDTWQGVDRITFPVRLQGAPGTLEFDWACVRDVVKMRPGVALTLGYNTAVFCLWMRLLGVPNLINMDGLEWRRDKWRTHERAWLWANERIGCWTGEHLIADHPAIADHLATRVSREKISTIAYGAEHILEATPDPLANFELTPDKYGIVIGRPEPENSILEVVRAFSRRTRHAKLVVLGKYEPDARGYHREVMDAASEEVVFPGAIYDARTVRALRFHARFYLHGHKVGGTNPSLVEALGAGNAIIAHDNVFNRWVAGAGGRYFASQSQCEDHIADVLGDDDTVAMMRASSVERFANAFRWDGILNQYEMLLERYCDVESRESIPTPKSLSEKSVGAGHPVR
jgi:glycosyltransferase involved in cell wall biosynthesis